MKPALNHFYFFCVIASAMFLGVAPTANCQPTDIIPQIKFTDVHITLAIENFSRLSSLNCMIDPKLFSPPGGSNPNGIPEPKLTLKWTNITADAALARILKENNLVMVQDKFTTVTLITGTNHVAHVVDASLLVSTNTAAYLTNGLIPEIHFWNVPLDAALKNLIAQGRTRVVLDPKVSTEAGLDRHKLNFPLMGSISWGEVPTVRIHWQNLTAQQALVALCENYDLVIVKDAATGVVGIQPRE